MEPEKDIFHKLVEKAKTTTLTDRERSKLFMTVDTYVERNPIKIKAVQTSATSASSSISSTQTTLSGASTFKNTRSNPFTGVMNGAKKGFKSAERTFRSKLPESFLPIKSPLSFSFSNIFSFNSYHSYSLRTAAVLLVVVVFGTGTSFAAQVALPGDLLYPIKVSVNEEIKSIFLSGVNETEYEVVRAKERIEEVKKLIAQNKLSPDVQVKIATKLSSHVTKVEKGVEELTKKGELKSAFEISSNLENSLVESEIAIAKIAKNDVAVPGVAVQVAVAENIIRSSQKNSATTRETTENKIYTRQSNDSDTKIIALAKLESLKKNLALIDEKTIINSGVSAELTDSVTAVSLMAKSVPAEDLSVIQIAISPSNTDSDGAVGSPEVLDFTLESQIPTREEQISKINILIAAGEEKLVSEEFNEAFRIFREADQIAESIKTEIETQNAQKAADLETISVQNIMISTKADGAIVKEITLENETKSVDVFFGLEKLKTKPVEKKPR